MKDMLLSHNGVWLSRNEVAHYMNDYFINIAWVTHKIKSCSVVQGVTKETFFSFLIFILDKYMY